MRKPSPIFSLGSVPFISCCSILEIEWRTDGYYYYIENPQHPTSSSWISEDNLIKEVTSAQREGLTEDEYNEIKNR